MGSAFAANQGAKANRDIQKSLQDEVNLLEGFFNQEKYQNPFTRPDTQAALTRSRDALKDAMRVSRGNAIRTGATAESETASQGKIAEASGRSYTDILSGDARRREMAKNRYANMLTGAKGRKVNFDMQDAQKWQQMMANLGNLSDTAIDVLS